MMRRLTSFVVFALVAAACTGSADPQGASTSTSVPDAATSITVAVADWPECFNPLTCDDGRLGMLVLQHVLPKLFEVDAAGALVPSPVLDGLPVVEVDDETGRQRISYRIASAARWHDGRPMTSSDVLGTWLAATSTPGAPTAGYERIVDVDDTDPLVAVVTLTEPFADWRELFGGRSGWLLQPDAFPSSPNIAGAFLDTLPFGAGPYEVVAADDDVIVLAAREEYWAPERAGQIEQVRLERVRTGEQAPRADVVVGSGIDIETTNRWASTSEVINVFLDRRTLPLQELPVRAAIDAAISRTDLAKLLRRVADEPAAVVECLGWLPGTEPCDAVLPAVEPRIEEAGALLDSAGWLQNDDGIRTKRRSPLTVPVTVDAGLPNAAAVMNALRLRLQAVGFAVEATAMSADTFFASGRTESAGVAVFSDRFGRVEDLIALLDCSGGPNAIAWCTPAVADVSDRLAVAMTDESRVAVGRQASSIAAQEIAWLPLHRVSAPWSVATSVIVPGDQPDAQGPLAGLARFVLSDG